MKLSKAVALRITKLLSETKKSKYSIEKKSGISHSALRHIFNEKNNDVNFSTIVKIAYAFDMSLSEFFNDKIFDLNNLEYI